jgi:hypothetical protein
MRLPNVVALMIALLGLMSGANLARLAGNHNPTRLG